MAVRRWWRLWKRSSRERAEEKKGIDTNPTGVKHRSPLFLSHSCSLSLSPPPFPHATTDIFPVSLPLRLLVSPSFLLLLVCHCVSTFLSKSSHVPYVSLTLARRLFPACFSPLSTLMVILFPSFYPPIYLSTRIFPSSSFFILPIRLPISLARFTFAFPPAIVLPLPAQTSPSRSMTLLLAPVLLPLRLIPPKPAPSLPRLLFPATLTARYPRQSHPDTTNSSAIFTADGAISCVTTATYR